MITSMWNEIMHGASGSYYFCLGGWLTEWKDLEGARKQVETPSWKSYMMLNPYAYPVETLDAFKTFMKELEPYRDQVLPFPRCAERGCLLLLSNADHVAFQQREGSGKDARMVQCGSFPPVSSANCI